MVHFISTHKKAIALLSLLFVAASRVGAVPVHINSGNPAFPFPQFLEYTYGTNHRLGNLGTKNAEGVVHAELEQDIRDAYQVHANEFAYTGDSWGGYKYIWTPYKSAYDCTEGDGYGLLAAAYMGDAVTFNGYWMCTHDKRRNRSKKYSSCTDIAPDYAYGPFAIGDNGPGGNTAADGDVDVALALYVAYKQWGEFMRDLDGNIVNDACGNPISYKEAMIEVIRGLVALSTKFPTENPMRVNSGLIGLDGYPKGGDTWNEQTHFVTTANPITVDGKIYDLTRAGVGNAMAQVDVTGVSLYPEFQGGNKQHIDYDAPAYFREFWELFEELGGDPFEIEQFKRGEASSDWLIGNLISKNAKAIPTAGWSEVSDDGSTTSYSNFNQGEDYRCSWRTISNHTWHGNPVNTWNPKTHKAESGSNTYEYDAAVRLSEFLNDPAHWNESAGSKCITYGDPKIPYSGPATLNIQYDPMTGITQSDFYVLNWQVGTGTFAAVSAQDFDLMGLLYRQCAIEWDVTTGGDCYLTSVSNYMHGWARHLGMMVTSGNYHAPSQMNPSANMKIYRSIEDSVTYCYTGDQIKFVLDYRNYGTVDAEDVKIVEKVPSDFVFVEASSGGVYDKATHTVTWNIGKVSGFKSDNKEGVELDFKSGNLAKTIGQVWYKLRAGDKASGRYCTTAEITCSNGLGWTTNEYPNFRTPTMQRNCVDVVARSLLISKDVDRRRVNDGNMATYTIKFENSSEAGWIDGGRPRVNVSFANGQDGARLQLMARLWNDAIEPYINYGNYRISYYLYDASINCYAGEGDCTTGWGLSTEIYEGNKAIGSAEGITVSHENIVEGSDEYGKWNQRMCIQFAPLLVTTTMHVSRYFGGAGCRIHKGGFSPMRGVWALYPSNYGAVNWNDDWSWSASYNSEKDGLFYPVTPSWQKLDEKGKSIEEPVNKWLTCGCTESSKTVPNILVEEYDGYVWRRILGNGPMAGRDVDNVVIRDTLPKGLKFGEFVNECPLSDPEFGGKWEVKKTSDGRDIIIWSIPKLQVKQKGSIIYTAEASFPSGNKCETADEDILNYAWIEGDKNSPISDTAKITVTCAKVPDPIIPTTLTKVADKENYEVGDEITYTIGYKQTHGAIFENAASKTGDWSFSGGASATGGKISLSQGQKAEFKKISNNIYVEAQWSVSDDQETSIYFRDNIKLTFKNEYGGLTVTCYDGNRKIDSKIIAKAKSSSKLAINLTDDVLRIWVNKDTATSASVSFDGLTKKDGYFGFDNATYGNFAYSDIHVHTDYAYDLSIVDLVPAEVEVDESSFKSTHNGSAAGSASLLKGADGDSIVWTGLANNPIAFGDTFTVTWKGMVKECSEKIFNIAKAKLLGHAHNKIMAQAVSGCGEECPLPNVTLTISDDTICAGSGSAKLVAGPVGKYTYIFYENGMAVTEETSENTYVTSPIAAGKYKYTVEVISGTTQLPCYSPSDSVILVAEKLPVASDYDLGTFCSGNADLTAFENARTNLLKDNVVFEWFDADGNSTDAPDINSITEPGDYLFSYSLTTPSGCESRKKGTLKFTVKAITAPTGTYTVSYLLGDTASNGKFEKNLIQQDPAVVDVENGYTYNWYDENDQLLSGVPTPSPQDVGKKITYRVNRTQPVGCVSDTVDVTVIVSGSSVPTPNNVTYCLNEDAQPISATLSEVKDSDASWEIVYYDADGNELKDESLRTPNTSVAGATTYYVSQREVGNSDNESGKVPLVVTVIEVPTPDVSMNRTQYCKGEEYEKLEVKSLSSSYDANKSSFSWYMDGKSVTGVPLAQTQTEVVSYGVVESYEIEPGHVCVSDTAKFAVKSTFVPVATGSLSVNYLKEEAGADGSFESLLTKDPSAVSSSDNSDYELVWFDEGLNELGTTDPSPMKDNSWKENEDVVLTYFVKQRHKESGCLSDTVRITVVLSDALVPNTFPMNYCHHAQASSLEHSASINTNRGQIKDIDYELVWFSPDDNYASSSTDAPVPSTENVGVTIYKVAQKHKADGAVSSKADVKVTVFPNPEIKVDALPQTCGEEIEISKYIHLANTVDTSLLNYYYFSDRNCTNPLSELTLTESTVFYANAYYTIFSQPNIVGICSSDTLEMNATIDDLSDLAVDAPSSVCPNGDIRLKASAKSTTSTVSFEWGGAATGTGDVLDTKDESGVFGKVYSYQLTASAGACHLDTTVSVTVGKGELTGEVLANNQATHIVKVCEGETVELSTTHEGEDFKWSDLSGDIVSSDKDASVSPSVTTTYVLSFVNKCETSDTVVVEVYPLSLTADFKLLDTSICENSSASALLTINGYDQSMPGSYIKWMKNGDELTEFANQTSLQLYNVTKEDGGEYTYEVSNGICLAKTSDTKTSATLDVKPYVSFSEPTTVEVPHGGSASLTIGGLTPSDAAVDWQGVAHSGEGNPFEITDMVSDELFNVTLSAEGYCESETELQVLVDAKAVVSISVSSDAVCVEDGVMVTADTTGTGHLLYPDRYQFVWYTLDGEANLTKLSGNGLSIHDYPQSSVSYFAVVTYGNQQAVSDTLAVEVVSPAVYSVTEDAVSCSGDDVTIEVFSDEEDVEVEWKEDGTKAPSIVVAPLESTSYAFVISRKGLCPVSDQIPVSVKEKPSVTMEEDKTICEGVSIVISPTVTGKEYSGFEWTNPEGDVISRDLKLETSPNMSGEYTLLVQTTSCGDASASIQLKVIPKPELYIDSIDFSSRKIEVAAGGTGLFEYKMDNYDWQTDNLYENLAYNVLHTAYVRDDMGCVGMSVFSIAQPPIPIPDYFTPDGSGVNEVWDVAPIMDAYPNATVKIFDRSGKVVAELNGSTSDWDGTYNGHPLPSTDYWYLINVPEIRQQFKGHFTLIRGN